MEHTERVNIYPQFVNFLATYPPPQQVFAALVQGPLAQFNVTSAHLFSVDSPNSLVLTGTTAQNSQGALRYRSIPRSIDMPMTKALRELSIEVILLTQMLEDYPSIKMDESIWLSELELNGEQNVISSPIISRGIGIGAFAFLTPADHVWTPSDHAFLSGLSSLLGLWLAGLNSINETSKFQQDPEIDVPLNLGSRQLQILRLVEQGRSNASIAFTLGYSESTVKQDLQRAMKILRTKDRLDAAIQARNLGMQD